ncbi:MAG TPA: methionine--tRNA ligase subunit beta [Planctomycetaceae bacterium]|nr:methionine--tRNA ligase subunit beta [Planctomycetaceae bacterium]
MTDQSAPESPQPEPPQPSAPPSADKPLIPYDVFAQVDLRVATVLEAREHPNANKLLLLQIQVGDVRKQIVAGIRGHYEPTALVGRQIIIVNNLEPAMLRGEESNGMLLAATDEKGVVLLRPDREMTSGSKVK